MAGVERSGGRGIRPWWLATGWELVTRHALLVIVVAGAVLRFATLGVQGFWLDEHVTLSVIQQGPLDLLRSVQLGESNPAVYYLLAGGWERVFGSSELGIRSLSALAGVATIPLLYAATRTLGSRRAALIAAALAATSPLLIWYSQETRNYALFAFFAALAFLLFARALEDRGQRWLWGWALVSALALATHYFAFFLIVPQFVWLILRRPGSRVDTVLSAGVIAVVGVALLPLVASQRGRGDWISAYDLGERLLQVPEHFLVGLQVPWEALPAVVAAGVGLVFVLGALTAGRAAWRGLAIPVTVLAAGLAMLLIAVLAGDDYILSRNLIGLWVPFAIALALVLDRTRPSWLGVGTAAAVALIGVALAIWIPANRAAQRPHYSELAAELSGAADPRLIVSQSSFSSPLSLYLDGARVAGDDELSASELIVIEQRPTESHAVGLCWWIATCGGIDVEPPPPFEVPSGFELRRSGSTESFDYDLYTAPREIEIQRPLEYFTPRVLVQTP
jgi:uncharacterized membrane protein